LVIPTELKAEPIIAKMLADHKKFNKCDLKVSIERCN